MIPISRVIGYHGTSLKVAETILSKGANAGGYFLRSENESDWLGDGVYFFQDAPWRAREWPQIRMPKHTRVKDPVVLGAEIYLTEYCLDLIDIKAGEFIANEYNAMEKWYQKKKWTLPQNKGTYRKLDRRLINFVTEGMQRRGERVDLVRAAFEEGDPVAPGSSLYSHAHVQIVVRPERTAVIGNVWFHNFT